MLGWLTTVDHKRIGLLYFWTTLVFFAAGGIEALTMRTQLTQPEEHVVGPGTYDQLLTMYGITMIFFFIIPMTTGAFGNYLVPLMIGAREINSKAVALTVIEVCKNQFGKITDINNQKTPLRPPHPFNLGDFNMKPIEYSNFRQGLRLR